MLVLLQPRNLRLNKNCSQSKNSMSEKERNLNKQAPLIYQAILQINSTNQTCNLGQHSVQDTHIGKKSLAMQHPYQGQVRRDLIKARPPTQRAKKLFNFQVVPLRLVGLIQPVHGVWLGLWPTMDLHLQLFLTT